ncbi:hypothetical protein B0T10DRAFT_557344 [Thelonectria olida]|uniref:Uncharacterized protein n=1 Tax=Thelonectria olida TaxID=1576542 RepID=A0A9P9AVV8_9HYPO|nr:hypothetical protein B0T10DRAFT_557344 [Thelonectria olida]
MGSLASSCSSSPQPSPVRNNGQGTQGPKQPSALYSMFMTPVNLTVFLLSLVIVDLRYSLARAENASGRGVWPWLPVWLRRVVLSLRREKPYGGSTYYHSKQKKLMKMEADEAFQLHGLVLAALVVLAVVSAVVVCCVGSRVYGALRQVVVAVRR